MTKEDAIKRAQKNDNDRGSTEVQISILSEKIENLLNHLKTNKKDLHSKRGLLKMVSQRRSLIKYLKRVNLKSWEKLAEKVGLKK